MKDQFASYFEKPEFKQRLAHYEEMLLSGSCFYFEATELTDIAEYYAIQGDSQRAEEVLDYAIRLYPDNIDVLIFKARARLINGYVNEAITIAESITDSNDREVLLLKAELALADSRYRQAEDILRALIETEDYEANTYADIIDLLVDNRQGEMAIKWTDEALTSYPSNKALLESAAYNYTQQELYEEAIGIYNQLLDTDAYCCLYWEELGKIHFLREEYDKAIEAFEFVVAINSDDSHYSIYALANCYFNVGNYERAQEYYSLIRQQYPTAAEPLFHMGMCYANMGDDDHAIEYLTEALATIPEGSYEQGQIYSQLSLITSRRGQHEKAIAYIDEAIRIHPDNTELTIMKGHELLCQGLYNESTETFLKALDHNEEDTERLLFLIAVSMLENDHYTPGYYILSQLKGNSKIDTTLLYPYLCLCEWILKEKDFKATLAEALAQCPQKTYEIFTLEPAQGESAEQMIERLKQLRIEN